jgi:hypothetical protein
MADTRLSLPEGGRNIKTPVNPASLSLLQRLRSLTNQSSTGDFYLDRRRADIATGADEFEPTEGELLQQQLAPMSAGGGTYETPGGNTGSISRDLLREAGAAQFKRRLKALNEQYVLPKQYEGEYGMATERVKNAGALATEQLRGQNAATTAAVPRTVNTNVTTNAGAGGSSDQYQADLAERALNQVNYIIPKVSAWTSGMGGGVMRNVYGTGARELQSELEALKSDIGFKALQEMRAASKTGGALGQVSDTENKLLAQSLGGLDQTNSPEVLKKQLENIAGSLQRWSAAKRQSAQGGVYLNNGLGLQINAGGGGDDPYGLFGEQ